ncbi:DUF1642 domain-containing protein [Enterococcus dongliensis]|uniref:DUF1642 domain-containing protein n=1 Tax=Enterococcus dongliensis TaxID=2559925 RepID=UPI0028912B5E|nr:DUF1642 domain-containing protein [Enterococcus dongliensis]MDT2674315.1 DUF1642 domain-containing protein [Enterococcus dongliensis]
MNKQEVIERLNNKLDEVFAFQRSFKPLTRAHMECESKANAYMTAINYVEQLDEPQKVKVKQFVADWFEEHKHNLSNSLWEFTVELNEKTLVTGAIYTEFESWFIEHPRAYEFITSMGKGYEVEEEPKWKIINDQKYCLTSIEAGYGNSLHWAFDSTKKKPILFDNEETALYTAYITGGTVEKV